MLTIDTNEMPAKQSSRTDKCFNKQFYNGGDKGPYTAISIIHPGGAYPKHRIDNGLVEYFVLKGRFHLNGRDYEPGTYIQLGPGDYSEASSSEGCEVLVVLRGKASY
jgi:hypothetical protein